MARHGTARAENSVYPVPAGLTEDEGDSVIVAEVSYQYTPILGQYITGPLTFNRTFYVRPRFSPKVTKTN